MANTFLQRIEKESLGTKIRLARIRAGLTQQQLAEKLYVTQSSISDFEHDISEPRWTLMLQIVINLGTGIEYFYPTSLKSFLK